MDMLRNVSLPYERSFINKIPSAKDATASLDFSTLIITIMLYKQRGITLTVYPLTTEWFAFH